MNNRKSPIDNHQSVIRVFARRTKWTPTDDLAFYDEPPLYELPDLPVMVSVTFTWDIRRGKRFAKAWSNRCKDVQIGGPAFDDPGKDYIRGRFLNRAVTITSRGCPKVCPWCCVPYREGKLREMQTISEGWVVQDNNLLACSRGHIERVFEMLSRQPIPCSFPGGLDLTLIKPWHIVRLTSLMAQHKLASIWVSFDTEQSLQRLGFGANIFADLGRERRRAYVLIGYNGDSPYHAEKRLELVYAAGFLPFAMLYQPIHGRIGWSQEWKALQRKWARPAAYRCVKTIANGKS